MEDFVTSAFGYLKDLQVCIPALKLQLDAFTASKFRSIVGRLGGCDAGEFGWPYAAQCLVPYAPTLQANWSTGAGPWFASRGEVASAMSLPTTAETGGAMNLGYPGLPMGYWGNLMPALAYAVEQGAVSAGQAGPA